MNEYKHTIKKHFIMTNFKTNTFFRFINKIK